uniref:DUF5641 domain-containing protein n=1 Tax=Anopheles epiroticus TaxID=199890 RepID=A0A182PWU9_9DIPT
MQPRVSIVPERFQVNAFSAFDPSQMQYTFRHAAKRDLPMFSGNPEEWPMFIASFEYTTEEYGYNDVDNLDRLQKALKGKALESVRCLLMHPSNVPAVIRTLRMLYGRPEIIVHSLMNKVRAMPAPKQDRLNTLIDFGVAVQNLCATITATGLDEYMYNVALLHELTERLPPSLKLNWGCHQMSVSRVTLSSFNDWLNHLVQAASLPINHHQIALVEPPLFRYVPVTLHGNGCKVDTFAFLDDGSSATFVEHALVEELGLHGTPHPLCLWWTGNQKREEKNSVRVTLRVSGREKTGKMFKLPNVHTVQSLALPKQSLSAEKLQSTFEHLRGLKLNSYTDIVPRVLIGIDNCHLGNPLTYREGKSHEPVAAKTRLGWIVYGSLQTNIGDGAKGFLNHHSPQTCPCVHSNDDRIDIELKQYLAIDSLDDIVLIADNNLPRNCWPKGRVIEVVRANDGQVRRASVQTTSGIIERPATKIAVLDVYRQN